MALLVLAKSRHRGGMAEYKILDGLKGYGVEVVSRDRFLPVRGFATERDAAAWVVEQQAGEAAVSAATAEGSHPA